MASTHDPEPVLLRCERCGHTQPVAMAQTEGSHILACDRCGGSIYWHQCPDCGLQYVGGAIAHCAICDDAGADELQIV